MMEEVKKTGLTFIDTRRLANMSYKDIKNGFVGFGYYLKIIHDEKLWQGNGYNSFNQFLDAEYGKDKSWASRCINLYGKFGIPVEPGELPRLEEQYEAYNVSQLIEMLPMDDGLREQVTPDMKIPDIREMKPKRKKKVATVATPEPTPAEPEQDSCPPDMSSCRRQEWGTGPAEQEAGKKECKACWASWKRQHKALGAGTVESEPAEAQQEKNAETQQEPNEVSMSSLEECVLDFQQNHMCKRCLQAVDDRDAKALKQELISNHGKRHNSGSTSYGFYQCDPDRIYFQDDMCETFLSLTWNGYVKELFKLLENSKCREIEDAAQESGTAVSESNPPENVIDGEFTEIQEPEEGASDQEAPMTELQIAQGELERAKRLLEKGLGCGVDENDIHIRRLKTAVCAWASYVCDLDSIVNPPPKPVQPELPVLKNNDQRAAFIDNYETWPLWIETAQTGERYYRYDLEDGTSMVVKVYHAKLFYSIEPGGHDFQYREGYGRHEYYLLQPGKFFRDCDTNRSLLIEKLKEIQKPKKG